MASIRPPGQLTAPTFRPKKTHDGSNLGAIQKMSMALKRVKNKKIAANNEEKGLRFEAHKAAPSPSNSPISSLESLITTENGHVPPPGPPPPPTPPSHMAALLAKLSPNSIKDLLLNRKRPNDTETHEEAEERRKRKYSRQGELTRQPGDSRHLNEFHPVLVKAVDEGNIYLPLHLFTSGNLTIISSRGFSLPDKKVYLTNGTSVRILDIDNSIFGKEAEMTEVQWRDAFPRYIEFMRKLGGDIWAERWESHFKFFYDIVNLSLVFQVVLRACIHLRKDYHAQFLAAGSGFAFTEEYYTATLEKTKGDIRDEKERERDARDREREASWASKVLGSGPSAASVAKTSSAPMDASSSAATLIRKGGRFLRGGNSAKPLADVCLVCARKGHKIMDCTFSNLESGEPTKPQENTSASLSTSQQTDKADAATPLPTLQSPTNAHGAYPWTTTRLPGDAETRTDPTDIRNRIVTPYNADAIESLLAQHNLLDQHPDLALKLRSGFPMGDFPPLHQSVIFPNYVLDPAHTAFIDDYFDEEETSGRMSGPFSREEVEAILGPFQCSPCSVNSQDQGPDLPPKLRVVRNLSKGSSVHPSTNDFIDSSKFPTRFGSAAEVAKIVSVDPLCSFQTARLRSMIMITRRSEYRSYWSDIVADRALAPTHRSEPDPSPSDPLTLSPARAMSAQLLIDLSLTQISDSPLGTQAMTLDIAKFHRTCLILPDHKPYFVVQGSKGFFIEHTCPFGCSSSESNAGSIANAIMDIWTAMGVSPSVKWVDDLNIFRLPASRINGSFSYHYDMQSAKALIDPIRVPWHKEKWSDFASCFIYIGFRWDIEAKTVSLPESKRLKYLSRVRRFIDLYQHARAPLSHTLTLQGSLVHIAFVYPLGRSHLPSLFYFSSGFNGSSSARRYPSNPLIRDLRWWDSTLSSPCISRSLKPHGPTLPLDIFVDASTDWEIGIVVDGSWDAWRLIPGWKDQGRNIGWLEALAVELVIYAVMERGIQDASIIVHSDNQGVIGSFDKGRSRSFSMNLAIQRCSAVLAEKNIHLSLTYVASAANPADPISRGDLGLESSRLHLILPTPDLISDCFIRFASSKTTAVCPVVPDSREPTRSSSLPYTPSAPSEVPPRLPISKSKPRKPKEGCEIIYNAFRPHVTAEDRLFCWTSPFSHSFDDSLFNEVPQDAALILKLAQSALEKSTLENYSAGLLRFHQFCDEREIPESARMPASVFLLSAFVAWASTKNIVAKTIGAWLTGVHGWHTLHGAPWYGGDDFVSLIKSSASKKATGSPRPKRRPVTIEHLIALQSRLNFKDSFDVAVFAVALCAFWGCCRLGELTIPSRNSFDPRLHVAKSTPISFRNHLGGASSAHFHIPWGKMERQEGADLIFTAREALCPVKALRAHLTSNKDTPDEAPLFAFRTANGSWAPMVKQWFLDRCREIWIPLNCDHVHGHSFRPGGATELLLAGVPPETVAKLGRWKSLAFLIYWRKLEELIPTMISASYSPSRLADLQTAFESFRIAHKLPDKIVL
ncbi:uncharacterized protein ARMOST_17530 [Armillaria ostoyae]|uniref:Tyr recombinase domain-containing protein n=1 Tax=Armillaria ostoyae TaxID=47428 RepID=A0A284RZ85_ARMOS|nr:uncharacterized protein ARMOST_17530 [Armillaria ostoyae]